MVVQPTYPLTAGLSLSQLRSAVTLALGSLGELPFPPEWIDRELMEERGWSGLQDALLEAHNPQEEVRPGCVKIGFYSSIGWLFCEQPFGVLDVPHRQYDLWYTTTLEDNRCG